MRKHATRQQQTVTLSPDIWARYDCSLVSGTCFRAKRNTFLEIKDFHLKVKDIMWP